MESTPNVLGDAREILAGQFIDPDLRNLSHRKRTFWVLITVWTLWFIPALMTFPVQVEVIYDVVCRNLDIAADKCSQSVEASEKVASLQSISAFVKSVPVMVMIPIVTAFAESQGYVRGLTLIMAGLMAQFVLLYPLAYWVPAHWSIYRIVLVDLLDALVGSDLVLQNLMTLVITQLFYEPELRPRYMSFYMAGLSAALIIGPLLGGFLSRIMPLGLFYAGANGMQMIMIVLFASKVKLPRFALSGEALEEIHHEQFSRQNTPLDTINSEEASQSPSEPLFSSMSAQTQIPGAYSPEAKKFHLKRYLSEQFGALRVFKFAHLTNWKDRLNGYILVVYATVFSDIERGAASIVFLYTKQVFGWDQRMLGILMATASLVMLAWSAALFPLLQSYLLRQWRARADSVDRIDKSVILLGPLFKIVGLIGVSHATTSKQFIGSMLVRMNSVVATTVLKTAILKLVPIADGATLVTALALADALNNIALPSLMMWMYKETLSWWPTFVFELDCVLSVAIAVVIIFFLRVH